MSAHAFYPLPPYPEDHSGLGALYGKTPSAAPSAPPADAPAEAPADAPVSRPRRRRRTIAGCRAQLRRELDGRTLAPRDIGELAVQTCRIAAARGVPPVDVGDVSADLVWEVVCQLWSDVNVDLHEPVVRGMCRETAKLVVGDTTASWADPEPKKSCCAVQ